MDTMDYFESAIRTFTDKYAEGLIDRQVAALNLIARRNARG
jgi:hypothetical protein